MNIIRGECTSILVNNPILQCKCIGIYLLWSLSPFISQSFLCNYVPSPSQSLLQLHLQLELHLPDSLLVCLHCTELLHVLTMSMCWNECVMKTLN